MIAPILDADEFAGRVCIVTGAARGIGAAIAESLARLGGTVVVADINLEGAAERSEILAGEGLRARRRGGSTSGTPRGSTSSSAA